MTVIYSRIQIVAKAMFLIYVVMPCSLAGQQPEIATTVAFTEGPPSIEKATSISPTSLTNGS